MFADVQDANRRIMGLVSSWVLAPANRGERKDVCKYGQCYSLKGNLLILFKTCVCDNEGSETTPCEYIRKATYVRVHETQSFIYVWS
jgi:hypothetical protein